jgi:hypothetical protein
MIIYLRDGESLEEQRELVAEYVRRMAVDITRDDMGEIWLTESEIISKNRAKWWGDQIRPRWAEAVRIARRLEVPILIGKLGSLANNVGWLEQICGQCEWWAADFLGFSSAELLCWSRVDRHRKSRIHRDRKPPPHTLVTDEHRAKQKEYFERAWEIACREVGPIVVELHRFGLWKRTEIATALNARGVPTPFGRGRWNPEGVSKLYDRLGWVVEGRKKTTK